MLLSGLMTLIFSPTCFANPAKKAALLWAEGHVDPQWSNLIQQALDDRRLGWDPHAPPRPGSVEQTLAFVEYVQRRVGVERGSR